MIIELNDRLENDLAKSRHHGAVLQLRQAIDDFYSTQEKYVEKKELYDFEICREDLKCLVMNLLGAAVALEQRLTAYLLFPDPDRN
jgi:hypothetical protein